MTPTRKYRHHSLLSVHKSDWLRSDYHIKFLTAYGVMLDNGFSYGQLRTARMINFGPYWLHPCSRYDTYPAMRYSAKELEALFIQTIGSVLLNFVRSRSL